VDLVALVGLVDERGWLLMQERDEHAPVDPNKWGLVGGAVEADESTADAARRELAEETGIVRDDLVPLGTYVLPCSLHGEDQVAVFTARTSLTDSDVECAEGRQIVFVEPHELERLDLTDSARQVVPLVLATHSR
jgi:8-oxo-dGTP diphosphatase